MGRELLAYVLQVTLGIKYSNKKKFRKKKELKKGRNVHKNQNKRR